MTFSHRVVGIANYRNFWRWYSLSSTMKEERHKLATFTPVMCGGFKNVLYVLIPCANLAANLEFSQLVTLNVCLWVIIIRPETNCNYQNQNTLFIPGGIAFTPDLLSPSFQYSQIKNRARNLFTIQSSANFPYFQCFLCDHVYNTHTSQSNPSLWLVIVLGCAIQLMTFNRLNFSSVRYQFELGARYWP